MDMEGSDLKHEKEHEIAVAESERGKHRSTADQVGPQETGSTDKSELYYNIHQNRGAKSSAVHQPASKNRPYSKHLDRDKPEIEISVFRSNDECHDFDKEDNMSLATNTGQQQGHVQVAQESLPTSKINSRQGKRRNCSVM